VGYLSAKTLLDIINEKNLLNARDQSPLTGLLGNRAINEYMSTSLLREGTWALVYFDLDNFKPYNDYYGFRNGDRVIKLLADIIKKCANRLGAEAFAGHIGGDDFFLGWKAEEAFERAFSDIQYAVDKFALDAESFYSVQDREKGFIVAKDRHGVEQRFPLISVSAAMLFVHVKEHQIIDEEAIALCYAHLKKNAKKHTGGAIAAATLL
jgi:diguanylate cyclase (GGDEF)-like protein